MPKRILRTVSFKRCCGVRRAPQQPILGSPRSARASQDSKEKVSEPLLNTTCRLISSLINMSQQVLLKLGKGNWQDGFSTVIVQLANAEGQSLTQWTSYLPPAPELAAVYEQWRSLYNSLYERLDLRQTLTARRSEIEIEPEGITNVSDVALHQLGQKLKQQVDQWLEFPAFNRAERQLRTRLSPQEEIRVIIELEDNLLRRFPWHLWSFFDDYPLAEVALSATEYGKVSGQRSGDRIRMLAILGNSQGIDVQQDRQILEQLPQSEIKVLVEPSRQVLDQFLWDEQGWDILFFAGHSTSDQEGVAGKIALNQTEQIAISQLKNGLKSAIAHGLKLAIFNSCDGLGLARELADLRLPLLVVMREPVPDLVAQEFLKQFLNSFSKGSSFYSSVRQAREKLQGLENSFPAASWLPTICQNPVEIPPTWESMCPAARSGRAIAPATPPAPEARISLQPQTTPAKTPWRTGAIVSVAVTGLVMGLRWLSGLQSVELATYDQMMRSRPNEANPEQNILIVAIDQEANNRYGAIVPDTILANLLSKLQAHQPAAIGLDIYRHAPRGTGHAQLMQQFQQHENLFGICQFNSTVVDYGPPQALTETQQIDQIGYSNLIDDNTESLSTANYVDRLRSGSSNRPTDVPSLERGIIRRHLISYDPKQSTTEVASPCQAPYSLSFQLAYTFLAEKNIQPLAPNPKGDWQFGKATFTKLPSRFGGYQNLSGTSAEIMLNYRTELPGKAVSLDDVLSNKVGRELVQGQIVLIGSTSLTARDYLNTPYGEQAGVVIHAHLVSQLISTATQNRSLIWTLPYWQDIQWGDMLWVFCWAGVGAGLVWRSRSWYGKAIALILTLTVLYLICYLSLIQGAWLPVIPTAIAILGSTTTTQLLLKNRFT
jgi:CHASE2 domain-containing sensor protein